MHLRSLVNLSGRNTIILKDDISVGELFSESLPENGYYFVNMMSSFLLKRSTMKLRLVVLQL